MGRKRGGYAGPLGASSRRARVVAETEEEDYAEKDPIALAIAAKERKREEYLKAAAMAAAKAAPPDITTWLAPGLRPANSEPNAGDANGLGEFYDPETITAPKTAAQHLDDGRNALTDLLGYSAEERREEARRAAVKDERAPPATQSPDEVNKDASAASDAPATGDEMDDEYFSFMGELEASGLLKDAEQSPQAAAAEAAPAHSDKDREAGSTTSAHEPAAEGGTQEAGRQGADEAVQAEATADQSGAAAAEQRVLGTLEGATNWSEVLDMGSGKVYFWNQVTNEVLWDPPAGSAPKSKAATDAIYEAGQAQEAAARTSDPLASEGSVGRGDAVAAVKDEDEAGTEVEKLAAEVSARLATACSRLRTDLEVTPLQRLAIEAQIRQQDWDTLSQVGALPWAPYERFQRLSWERIALEAEEAIQAAEAASQHEFLGTRTEPVSEGAQPTPPVVEANGIDSGREDGEISPGSEEGMDVDAAAQIGTATLHGEAEEALPPPLPADSASEPPVPSGSELSPPPLPIEASDGTPSGDVTPPLPADAATAIAAGSTSSPSAAAEYLQAAIANGVLPSAAPAVKRKEYSAQPVHAELDLSELEHEPQPPEPLPDILSPPLPEDLLRDGAKRKGAKLAAPGGKKKKLSAKVGKTASKLIDKWAAVRKDLVAEEEEEDEPDAEALERKRLQEAEEWRSKQSASIAAEVNANFQPVAGDWRQKVKAANKKQAKEAKAAAVSASVPAAAPAKGTPDLSALAVGLKPGWKPMWDPSTGDVYYGNVSTKETSWDRPT